MFSPVVNALLLLYRTPFRMREHARAALPGDNYDRGSGDCSEQSAHSFRNARSIPALRSRIARVSKREKSKIRYADIHLFRRSIEFPVVRRVTFTPAGIGSGRSPKKGCFRNVRRRLGSSPRETAEPTTSVFVYYFKCQFFILHF